MICFYLFIFQVYSLDGLLVLALLVVCTCAYITKVPRLKSFFLSEKKGFFGVFYKGKSMFLNKNNKLKQCSDKICWQPNRDQSDQANQPRLHVWALRAKERREILKSCLRNLKSTFSAAFGCSQLSYHILAYRCGVKQTSNVNKH